MNGFHSDCRDISAHEIASTIGKKIANWTVGNSTSPATYRPWQVPSEGGRMRRGLLLVLVAAVAVLAAGAGGTGKPDEVQPAKSAAAAPPTACVNGSSDLGDTYYPGIGNGGDDMTLSNQNLRPDPTNDPLHRK